MQRGRAGTLKGSEISNVLCAGDSNGDSNSEVLVRKIGEDPQWYRLTDMVLLELLKRHEWEIEGIGADAYIHSPVTRRVMLDISQIIKQVENSNFNIEEGSGC